jgi:23S rRNA pseudouridine955/2504/2580 synthase
VICSNPNLSGAEIAIIAAMTSPEQPDSAPKVHFVDITPERAGQRIDNFLITLLKGVPKTRIYRMLRKGEVRVNKGRIKATYRLVAGDSVRIPPVRVAEKGDKVPVGDKVLRRIEASILREEKGFLILNKPSGIAVHGGSGLSYGVIEALRVLRPEAPFLELVHRLDRDTSGCLIIAKRRSVLRELHRLLREDGMKKHYLALLKGAWAWSGGTRRVDAPLLKNVLRSGERMVKVDPEGKMALSLFRPITIYRQATLAEVELKTGRTHQIRVHALHMGHPIAGDEKYGDESFNREMREQGLNRLFLHAHSLAFRLPNIDEEIRVTAPLEPALENVLANLQKANESGTK